jgi:hypothetical protein
MISPSPLADFVLKHCWLFSRLGAGKSLPRIGSSINFGASSHRGRHEGRCRPTYLGFGQRAHPLPRPCCRAIRVGTYSTCPQR